MELSTFFVWLGPHQEDGLVCNALIEQNMLSFKLYFCETLPSVLPLSIFHTILSITVSQTDFSLAGLPSLSALENHGFPPFTALVSFRGIYTFDLDNQ